MVDATIDATVEETIDAMVGSIMKRATPIPAVAHLFSNLCRGHSHT